MKQGKRTKSAIAPNHGLDADIAMAAPQELPDAAYVDQLLAASDLKAATAIDAAAGVIIDDAMATVVIEQSVAATAAETADAVVGDVITLPPQCSMRDAVEFKQTFLNCLHADAIVIDVGAVERIDTAFIQMLLALSLSRADSGNEQISWVNVNKSFADAVRLLGLQSALSIQNLDAAA